MQFTVLNLSQEIMAHGLQDKKKRKNLIYWRTLNIKETPKLCTIFLTLIFFLDTVPLKSQLLGFGQSIL